MPVGDGAVPPTGDKPEPARVAAADHGDQALAAYVNDGGEIDDELEDSDSQAARDMSAPAFAPRLVFEPRKSMGMLPDDPMAEAGRKAILFHFERLIRHEPGSRLGDDIEEVHDMRVATRRMRSAFRIMSPYFKKDVMQPFNDELRQVARALGAVRDLDVFIDKAQRFAEKRAGMELDLLLQAWYLERRDARMDLIDHLDSKAFRRFVKDFHRFLTTPGKGVKSSAEPPEDANALIAYQVRHVVPQLIYARYERVRTYETVLDGAPVSTLHALRIDIKRLRYAVEFFVEVLGPEAKAVIEACKTMQDHLGDLNDAEVAIDRLTAFVTAHNAQFSGIPKFIRPDISGVEAYLVAQHAERQRLLDTFPQAWAVFNGEAFRRNLGLAVAGL